MEIREDLDRARRFYAEEVQLASGIENAALVEAFAKVPRERFLGSPPWQVVGPTGYRDTPDDDPRQVYHNILFAIDPKRGLNNGHPSFLASLIESTEPGAGQHIVHVGCGTGYYAAILAELVGEDGIVTAIEIDPGLAEQARKNLAYLPQVDVVQDDGNTFDPGATDAFLINAGATHPSPLWLERMLPGARMVIPLTVNQPERHGAVLKVRREGSKFSARFISGVAIYPCEGGRDDELSERLSEAFKRGFKALVAVRSLSIDKHEKSETCWLHADTFCLSTEPI